MRRFIVPLLFAAALAAPAVATAQTPYYTGIENATKTAYASAVLSLDGVDWDLDEVVVGNLDNDRKNGTKSLRMRGVSAAVTMQENFTGGVGFVTFQYAKYGTDSDSSLEFDYSTDDGSSWVNVDTIVVTNTALQEYSTDISQSGDVRLRVRKVTGSGNSNRANVDDITVYAYGEEVVVPTNVHFAITAANVDEDAGTYIVTVVKTLEEGNVSGAVTLGGTATEGAGDDYTIDTTNFTMNGATTSATFTITINDDEDVEGAETITLALADVVGGSVVNPSTFTLTINDNEAPPVPAFTGNYTYAFNGFSGLGGLPEEWTAASSGGLTNYIGDWTSGSTSGGFYGNQSDPGVIGYQHTGSSGNLTVTLTLKNDTGSTITDLNISYLGRVERLANTRFPIWTVSLDGSPVAALEYSTEDGADATRSTTVSGLGIPDGQTFSLVWASDRGLPSGSSRRIGIADVVLSTGAPPPPATNVQFAVAAASAGEDAGTYIVTVVKTLEEGNVSGTVTLGGTATEGAGDDYTIDTTNFTMNGATTSATFTITINDDEDVEGPETITLALADVVGGGVVSPSTFTLTINDNDVAPEPVEGIAAFRFTGGSLAASTKDANISVSDVALSAGTIATNVVTGDYFPNEPYIQATGGWAQPGQATAKNFFFTITPDSGYMVTVTGVSFRAYATGAGPSGFGYDIGGGLATYAADMPGAELVVVSNAVTGVDNQTGAITVMIQGWTNGSRAASGVGDFRIDDVVVFGTVTSAGPVPPVLNPIGNKTVAAGVPLGFAVTATPTDGDPVTLTVSNAPVGSTFGSTNENGYFTWANPGPASVYTVSFYATDKDGTDSEQISITVTSPPAPMQTNLWINEVHYDNMGPDTNEGFEIAGPAGTDLNGYNVYLYDLNLGSIVYSNIALSGVIPDEGQGFGALWFAPDAGSNGALFNGPDGLALVYNDSTVLQFISYEGAITAVDGPATGLTSEDIGLIESNTQTPVGSSLQVCGTGNTYSDFAWTPGDTTDARPASPGLLNDCQTISGGGSGYSQEQEDWIVSNWGDVGNYTGDDADDDGDNYSNIEEFIAGTDPVPPNGANSYFEVTAIPGAGASVPSVTGRLYRLWSIPNLNGAQTWTEVGSGTAGTGALLPLTDGATTNSEAYRVTVELAP